jgi:hypothetical protein
MKTYKVKVKHLSFKKPAIRVYDIQAESAEKAKAIVNNSLVLRHFTKQDFEIESVAEALE